MKWMFKQCADTLKDDIFGINKYIKDIHFSQQIVINQRQHREFRCGK